MQIRFGIFIKYLFNEKNLPNPNSIPFNPVVDGCLSIMDMTASSPLVKLICPPPPVLFFWSNFARAKTIQIRSIKKHTWILWHIKYQWAYKLSHLLSWYCGIFFHIFFCSSVSKTVKQMLNVYLSKNHKTFHSWFPFDIKSWY